MNKFTIVINSCKNFSDMWENDLTLYNKHWANHPEILIITDELDESFKFEEVKKVNGEMTDRIIAALDLVKTEYIFLSFDDYYPSKPVDGDHIDTLVDYMKLNNIDYCRFYKEPKIKGKKLQPFNQRLMPLKDVYEVNFYPSIWKVESLKKVLRKGEVIWKAEARITRRAKEQNLRCLYLGDKKTFQFVDVVRKGKYLRDAYRFLKKNKLYISDRPIRTIKETNQLAIQTFVSMHTPKKLKEKIKAKQRKKGRVFYSDYANTDD